MMYSNQNSLIVEHSNDWFIFMYIYLYIEILSIYWCHSFGKTEGSKTRKHFRGCWVERLYLHNSLKTRYLPKVVGPDKGQEHKPKQLCVGPNLIKTAVGGGVARTRVFFRSPSTPRPRHNPDKLKATWTGGEGGGGGGRSKTHGRWKRGSEGGTGEKKIGQKLVETKNTR